MNLVLLSAIFFLSLLLLICGLNKVLNVLPDGTRRTLQIPFRYLLVFALPISLVVVSWVASLFASVGMKSYLLISVPYSFLLTIPPLIEFTLRSNGVRPNPRIDMFEQSFIEWSTIEPHKGRSYITPDFHECYKEHFRSFKPKTNGRYMVPTGSKDGYIIVQDDFRLTVGNPKNYQSTVHLLGGSTTFCAETPNEFTYPSLLQKKYNSTDKRVRVLNYGFSGATLPRLVERLVQSDVGSSDLVVVFFGVNEAAHLMIHKQTKVVEPFARIPRFEEIVTRFATISLAFEWLKNLTVKQKFELREDFSVFESSLDQLNNFVEEVGSRLFLVIQPNIFSKVTRTDYETSIAKAMPGDYVKYFKECYQVFENICRRKQGSRLRFSSAISIFENLGVSPYLDTFHVNNVGNELIASFLFELVET